MTTIHVALLGLAARASLDAEAPLLAADLGVAPYDARLLLAPGFPAVVLSTSDRDRAMRVAVALRGRGHDVVAVDASAVVASSAMPLLRDFRLDAGALSALSPKEEDALPFDDLACIVRAWHRQRVDADTEVKKRSFDATRAIVSGGLVMTKTTTHTASSKTEAREEVLYLFRRSRQTPWLVRETRAKYGGLAPMVPVAPSQHENFVALTKRLRELAPQAAYDERLLLVKKIPEKIAISVDGATSTVAHSSEGGMDTLAHLLALLLSRRPTSPYRG